MLMDDSMAIPERCLDYRFANSLHMVGLVVAYMMDIVGFAVVDILLVMVMDGIFVLSLIIIIHLEY